MGHEPAHEIVKKKKEATFTHDVMNVFYNVFNDLDYMEREREVNNGGKKKNPLMLVERSNDIQSVGPWRNRRKN